MLCALVYRKIPKEKKETKETKEPDTAQKQQSTLKVTDQYIALLIRVFVAAGLLDVSDKMFHPNVGAGFLCGLGPVINVRREHYWDEPLSEGNAADG